jgi:hypothetical protein
MCHNIIGATFFISWYHKNCSSSPLPTVGGKARLPERLCQEEAVQCRGTKAVSIHTFLSFFEIGLTLSLQFSCLNLPSAGITFFLILKNYLRKNKIK